MRITRVMIVGLIVLLSGCITDDEDRCKKGYTWVDSVKACSKDEPEDTDSGGDVDTETDIVVDAGADAGADAGTETEGPALPKGLGEPCTATGNECAANPEANYCATNPRDPTAPGYCTIEQCGPGECPAPYVCCDCFGIYVFCMEEETTASAIANGCTCS